MHDEPLSTPNASASSSSAQKRCGRLPTGTSPAAAPRYRRQGYARAMLRALLVRAAAEPGVRTVRATIRADNNASLATIAGFGFTRVGEQRNERDELDIVFEVPAYAVRAEQLYGLGGHGDRPGQAVT
ncbi:GNAT family N-acetyltransferase [Streptomyces longisporoflavus]|uniref:GNAT family N-acetyltransferase n=1 Tax=Streptomyces longisporoflavus TaxID=28044 RepID=A0ABW7R2P8_9ACTN